MGTFRRRLTIIVPLVILTAYSNGQDFSDWKSRSFFSVQYKFNRKISVTGAYNIYLNKNISAYDRSVFSGEIAYEIYKWIKVGFVDQFGLTKDRNYNEFRYYLFFSQTLGDKWKIRYRPLWQKRLYSLAREDMMENSIEHLIRNRITVSYVPSREIELYVFTENYQMINRSNWNFDRQYSSVGIKFDVTPRNFINAEFNVFNERNGNTTARISMGYTHILERRKSR